MKKRNIRSVLMVGAVASLMAGCTSRVPTSWDSEFAKPNFMGQCTEGSPKSFCECVWDIMVDTVDRDVYKEFDGAQASAKSAKDIPALPSGIESAVEKCGKKFNGEPSDTTSDDGSDSDATTTTSDSSAKSTTTTEG